MSIRCLTFLQQILFCGTWYIRTVLVRLGLAATHEARIQASSANGVLVGYPSQEALKPKTVSTVRRGTVPGVTVSQGIRYRYFVEMTHFLWSVYQ